MKLRYRSYRAVLLMEVFCTCFVLYMPWSSATAL